MLAAARYEAFRGRGEAAMALYRQAAAQAPKDETPYRDMGDLLLNRLKRPAEAVKAYARAIELAPQDGAARFGLAMALLANDRKADALKSLAEAERLTVNDPNPAYMAGRIHASEKRFDAAIAAMGRALESSPAFVPALSDRADLQAEAGRPAAAAADYERLMKLQPNNPTTQLKLGMLYQRMGRFAEARNAYLAALQRNDQLAVAYNNLAMMGLRQGKDEGQIEPWARKAVALGAAVPNFHDTLGQVLAAKGDTQGALAAYREAVKLAPGEPELQFHLAQAYEAAGQRGEAKAAYERALAAKGVFEQAPQARQRLQALR
jgi:tetratricopeptide (TPR) repeat protein